MVYELGCFEMGNEKLSRLIKSNEQYLLPHSLKVPGRPLIFYDLYIQPGR